MLIFISLNDQGNFSLPFTQKCASYTEQELYYGY